MKQLFKQTKQMTEIKLENIETTTSGVKIANLRLSLDVVNEIGMSYTYNLSATSLALNIKDSNHSTKQMYEIADWLRKSSKNDDNLRTNEAEIKIFAKDMIDSHNKLEEIREL